MWKLDGLEDDRARGIATGRGLTITESPGTCDHGIVRHLRLQGVVAAPLIRRAAGTTRRRKTPGWVGGPDPRPDDRLVDSLASHVEQADRCDEVVRSHDLDDLGVDVPRNLRWVLHHLNEETARHLGHLDVLCEMADGRTGEQPSQAADGACTAPDGKLGTHSA